LTYLILTSNGANADKYKKKELRKEIIDAVIKLLNSVNPYVEHLRTARDRFNANPDETLHMRIVSKRETDGRVYNVPTISEVAMLIPGDFTIDMSCRDIIVEEKSGKLQRISEILPCYLPLQYPLLFPYGEDGFRTRIEKHQTGAGKEKKNKFISIRQWFAFRIHERKHEKHIFLRSKSLWQQFLVDSYTAIKSNRLGYIKLNQSSLREDNYNSVQKASEEGKSDLKDQGLACYLPATFTSGPRYMRNMYLDAMAVCKHFGFPDYFITFTCNPKWPELIRFCGERNLRAEDRPEIICKIFKMKLDSLMLDLTKRNILGKTSTCKHILICFIYSGILCLSDVFIPIIIIMFSV